MKSLKKRIVKDCNPNQNLSDEEKIVFNFLDKNIEKNWDVFIHPFALNREKAYGNEKGEEYLQWIEEFGFLYFILDSIKRFLHHPQPLIA